MPNQSLTDLPERTSTSGSDRIHVNNAGTDYQQTKENFTSDLAKEISFSTSSTLTSQIDALSPGAYYGFILSYGHQTATGMPYDVNFFVNVQKYDSNNCTVHAIARGTNPRKWTINKANSWGSWIEDPSRDEISALNNSLANFKDSEGAFAYRPVVPSAQNSVVVKNGMDYVSVARQHILCVYSDQAGNRSVFTIFTGQHGSLPAKTTPIGTEVYYDVSQSGNNILISGLGNWGKGYAIGLVPL